MTKHRGEIVEQAIRRSGFSMKRLAERLKISRNTLYNRFKESELGFEFIMRVSNVIHYDFTHELPEIKKEQIESGEGASYYIERSTAELLKLEKKYTDLLERYNKLLSILIRQANNNDLQPLRQEIMQFMAQKEV